MVGERRSAVGRVVMLVGAGLAAGALLVGVWVSRVRPYAGSRERRNRDAFAVARSDTSAGTLGRRAELGNEGSLRSGERRRCRRGRAAWRSLVRRRFERGTRQHGSRGARRLESSARRRAARGSLRARGRGKWRRALAVGCRTVSHLRSGPHVGYVSPDLRRRVRRLSLYLHVPAGRSLRGRFHGSWTRRGPPDGQTRRRQRSPLGSVKGRRDGSATRMSSARPPRR